MASSRRHNAHFTFNLQAQALNVFDSMHQVLQSPSLLSEIFSWLGSKDDYLYGHCSKACLSAAMTCRAFLSPALDIMWHAVFDFKMIARLLPQIRDRSSLEGLSVTTCHGDPIQKCDIQRLLFYTRRIRNLYLMPDNTKSFLGDVEPFILTELLIALNGDMLFPCLHTLRLEAIYDEGEHLALTTPFLPMFHSPTLEILTIDCTVPGLLTTPPCSPELLRFIQALPSRSTYLRKLSVFMDVPRDAFKFLTQMKSLTNLTFDVYQESIIDLSLVQELASIEPLSALTLRLTSPISFNLDKKRPDRPVFSNLLRLNLYADVKSTYALLSHFSFPMVQGFEFHYRGSAVANVASQWAKLIQHIIEELPTLTLLGLSSTPDNHDETEEHLTAGDTILSWSVFEPLLRLGLESLSIRAPVVDTLTKEDLENIVSSCPQLQTLKIKTNALGAINHSALHVIASKLRELKTLCLSLDLAYASPICLPKPYQPLTSLTHLTIPQSTIYPMVQDMFATQEMYDIARFLDALFPSLKNVSVSLSSDIGPQNNNEMEENIAAFIQGLQEARKRERSFIADVNSVETRGNIFTR